MLQDSLHKPLLEQKPLISQNKMLFVLTLLSFLNDCHLPVREKAFVWSEEQSYMNWYDSELACRKKGMRLPELKEMQLAQESKLTEERPWAMGTSDAFGLKTKYKSPRGFIS